MQNVLIQSDIPRQDFRAAGGADASSPKTSKKVRVRVEDDKDFRADRRRKVVKKKFEEIDIESDDTEGDGDDADMVAYQPISRSERRSRRDQDGDDADVPDELPENFKDGSVNAAKRDRDKERRASMPSRPREPKFRPAGFRKSTGSGDLPSGKKRGRPSNAEIQAKAETLAKAALEAEENRKAKLAAAGSDIEDEDVEESEDDQVEILLPTFTPVNGGPTVIRKSIFSKGVGPGGRKVKIVGKKNAEGDEEGVIPSGMLKKGPPGRKFLPGMAA
jgi:hypothetical protein